MFTAMFLLFNYAMKFKEVNGDYIVGMVIADLILAFIIFC